MSGRGGKGRARWNYARTFEGTDVGDLVEAWDDAEKPAKMRLAIVTDKGGSKDMLLSFRPYPERDLPWTTTRYGYAWRWRILKKNLRKPY